jgi:hypothetical protein
MGKTYRANKENSEMHEIIGNNSKKYFFNDRNNLRALNNLTSMLDDLKLEGCVIGGNAVSANYINFIQEKLKKFDLYKNSEKIKHFSRETADIDIVINGEKPKKFEECLVKYFGKTGFKIGKSNELDITIDDESPYLSFHFIEKNPDSQSEYFRYFVKNAKELSFELKKNKYTCRVANPLDLALMKLKSCDERVTESKKKTDLFDLNILLITNIFTLSQIIKRAKEIGYDKRYGIKLKKSLAAYANYVLSNNDEKIARTKLELTFGTGADNLEETINNAF